MKQRVDYIKLNQHLFEIVTETEHYSRRPSSEQKFKKGLKMKDVFMSEHIKLHPDRMERLSFCFFPPPAAFKCVTPSGVNVQPSSRPQYVNQRTASGGRDLPPLNGRTRKCYSWR